MGLNSSSFSLLCCNFDSRLTDFEETITDVRVTKPPEEEYMGKVKNSVQDFRPSCHRSTCVKENTYEQTIPNSVDVRANPEAIDWHSFSRIRQVNLSLPQFEILSDSSLESLILSIENTSSIV